MKNHVLNIDGDYASLRQTERVQSSRDVMNKLLKSSITDKTDARTGHADCGHRRLALALEEDRINDIHLLRCSVRPLSQLNRFGPLSDTHAAFALLIAISGRRLRSSFPCPPRGRASTTTNRTGTQDGGSLAAQCRRSAASSNRSVVTTRALSSAIPRSLSTAKTPASLRPSNEVMTSSTSSGADGIAADIQRGLFPAGDDQKPIRCQVPDVSGVKIAIAEKHLRRFGIAEISGGHMIGAHSQRSILQRRQ